MKRSTPILASIYALWIFCWWALEKGKVKGFWGGWGGKGILGLLLVHHLIAYPINLSSLKNLSPFADRQWFAIEETPQKSLDSWLERLQMQNLALDCRPYLQQFTSCDYDFIYSALKSACHWNNLNCGQIKVHQIL